VPEDEQERTWNALHLACARFDLAKVQWKATGRLPADLYKRGLDYHAQVADDFQGNFRRDRVKALPTYRQDVALALWGAREKGEKRREKGSGVVFRPGK